MRDFALTYPQLVRQAVAAGLDERDLGDLRETFEATQHYFDGLYRAGGQPFTCHMVRTASIVLAEGQSLPLVKAALVHAVYDTYRYEHSTRPWPGPRLRKEVGRRVGSDAESIVWAHHETDWESIGAPDIHLRGLPGASPMLRAVLALHLANDLENHLDLALTYRKGRRFKERIESDSAAIVQVARELDMPTLADELSAVFRETIGEDLPSSVRWDHSRGYDLPVGATSRTSKPARFAARARRGVAKRLGALLGRWKRRPHQNTGALHREREVETAPGSRPRLLVTGAAGGVGREIVPLLREHFSLRLLDRNRMRREGDDEIVRADVCDARALRRACRDVSAIVHLAVVDSQEPDFTTRMMPVNVDGTFQVFEAARTAGISRVVIASSGQVVGAYAASEWLGAEAPVRPSSVYACTKVFGEALARYYADCHGIGAICLRIGWVDAWDGELLRNRPEMRRIWCSPRDLAQLIVKSIQSDTRFAVLFAVSDNPRRHWDLEAARAAVGYVPADRAPDELVGEVP